MALIKKETIIGFVCDKCATIYTAEDDIYEFQERHEINFTGGYGSIFGDMVNVNLVLCQDCLYGMVKDLIEPEEDDIVKIFDDTRRTWDSFFDKGEPCLFDSFSKGTTLGLSCSCPNCRIT